MKRFIRNSFLFCLFFLISLLLVIGIDIFIIGNQYQGNYQASLIDKTHRLQTVESPKIILLGNSNVDFGMESSLIQEEFEMPTVDMGLHGGLGNAFHENMVNLGISSGDIVILCHSNYSDDDTISDPELALITLEHHKELWPILRRKDYIQIAKAFPKYFIKAFYYRFTGEKWNTSQTGTSYSRAAFNEYGDVVVRNDEKYTFTSGSVTVPEINDICTERINRLNEYITSQGATLIIAAYPIAYGEYTPDEKLYLEFEKELRDKVDCEVISNYTDYFMPYELFYNTQLHLTAEGAQIRTTQLIKDLKRWMGNNQ